MRILVLNGDYASFLSGLYRDHPGLERASHAEQLAVRNSSLFGVADYYSRNFQLHGHEAREIHVNNPWLQAAWAREHGLDAETPAPPPSGAAPAAVPLGKIERAVGDAKNMLRPLVHRFRRASGTSALTPEARRILAAQVSHYRPDVILNQDLYLVGGALLRSLRRNGMVIIGQIASPLPPGEHYGAYDLVISSLPNFVEWFRSRGVRSELNRLAFETTVLDKLGPGSDRDIDVSFVGSLSPEHGERIALLETIANRVKLQVWGNGIERLPKSSPLWRCYRGEAWGRGMYEVLRRSRMTINHHIDLSEGYANNMRLYEATGVGAAMLVDQKRNLREIFVPAEEVMAYESASHCAELVDRLLADEPLRARIAAQGQARTLAEHNYFRRTGEIVALAEQLIDERR
jgi:spore maturation protein CgeB